MSGRHRTAVAGLILLGILAFVLLIGFAGNACPVETEAQPCPDAARNVAVAIFLASVGAALLVTPFAFLAEVVARRRIVYRGAWVRAARRGVLVGLVLAALAGLRLGGALSVPVAIFMISLAVAAEWFLARRDA
jgi:MFS family permease